MEERRKRQSNDDAKNRSKDWVKDCSRRIANADLDGGSWDDVFLFYIRWLTKVVELQGLKKKGCGGSGRDESYVMTFT